MVAWVGYFRGIIFMQSRVFRIIFALALDCAQGEEDRENPERQGRPGCHTRHVAARPFGSPRKSLDYHHHYHDFVSVDRWDRLAAWAGIPLPTVHGANKRRKIACPRRRSITKGAPAHAH
jgi:hypothetical protein